MRLGVKPEVISIDANSSLTTPGYLVRSIESGLWFTTGDVVVATTPEIEDEQVIELQEAPERVDLLADEVPRRRIYGKAAPPMISHLVVGGVLGRGDGGSSQKSSGLNFREKKETKKRGRIKLTFGKRIHNPILTWRRWEPQQQDQGNMIYNNNSTKQTERTGDPGLYSP